MSPSPAAAQTTTPSQPRLRASVCAARTQLDAGRSKILAAHQRGLSGLRTAERLSATIDEVARGLFDQAIAEIESGSDLRKHVALVAHGGNGRRQIAPYSDVDMMVLHDGRNGQGAAALAKQFTQDVFDSQLSLGQSLRTMSDALHLVKDDPKTGSSLIETRLVAGSQLLYEDFRGRYAKTVQRRKKALCAGIIAERADERARFGDTNFLLEPNVKRSRGGLRDLHLLRWLAFLRHGITDWDRLKSAGGISKLDHHRVKSAQEFFLRLRTEMHFHASSPNDTLSRSEQMRIAETFGYRASGGLLPVEKLMKEFFWHTTQVWMIAERFIAAAAPRKLSSVLDPVRSRVVEEDFRVIGAEISATEQGAAKLNKNIVDVMRIIETAGRLGKRISASTWSDISLAVPNQPKEIPSEAFDVFNKFVAEPERLGPLLRRLLELGVLERLIPAFRHARCLLQANNLHKFTVDEHCILTVECATRRHNETGPLADIYRAVDNKRVLHLALLLHDLGKGFEEDHSELGARIARETAQRLNLPEQDQATIEWLVRYHLAMSRAALWRDPNDPQNVAQFVQLVPSLDALRMLLVLTCADLQAVGPGVLTQWKQDVLLQFYRAAAAQMDDAAIADDHAAATGDVQRAVAKQFDSKTSTHWLDALPQTYLSRHTPQEIASDVEQWQSLEPNAAKVHGRFQSETGAAQFVVAVDHGTGRGVFARLAGTLSGIGLQILSAEVNVLPGDVMLLQFTASESTNRPMDGARIADICNELSAAVNASGPPKIRATWSEAANSTAVSTLQHRVEFDDENSQQYTIVQVYSYDRRGLLYDVAQRLHDLDLTIHSARIATYLDQVVDVFYVTDRKGNRIDESAARARIRDGLMDVTT